MLYDVAKNRKINTHACAYMIEYVCVPVGDVEAMNIKKSAEMMREFSKIILKNYECTQ